MGESTNRRGLSTLIIRVTKQRRINYETVYIILTYYGVHTLLLAISRDHVILRLLCICMPE